jgi:2-polyprenyl-3-methyl-5-hydroxy-6-metoxy-1,4-benzoquinol methylase
MKGRAVAQDRILSWVEPNSSALFLDIGAGGASFSVEFAAKLGCGTAHILDGVDFSDAWTTVSQSSGIDIVSLIHNLEQPLPYSDERFDVVLSSQVLEHLYDPFSHLREIWRVLRADGYAIISLPNLSSLQYRLMLLFGFMPTTLAVGLYRYESGTLQVAPQDSRFERHISCFTCREFSKLLKSAKFDIVRARTSAIYFLPSFVESTVTRFLPLGNYMSFMVKKAINGA